MEYLWGRALATGGTGRKGDRRESGSNRREPLPWVATSCRGNAMVRRGFESVRGLCKSAGASAARWSAISTATRAGAGWVDRDGRRAIEPTGVAVDSPTTK